MNRDRAFKEALQTAIQTKAPIALVNAPIECAEDSDGKFGYCPEAAVKTLFRHGTLELVIRPPKYKSRDRVLHSRTGKTGRVFSAECSSADGLWNYKFPTKMASRI